ncbi:MAG TPA: GNAT family N-acetyltransferase [Dongiaceae bacterium]|nr:GNAT family N-acetyltransferase [Dongiaceae bacterium]
MPPARAIGAPAVRFRRARPGDVAAILRLMRGLYRQDGLRYRRAVARRALVGLMRAPRFGRVFVIDAGGTVAGYFVLTLSWSLEYTGGDAFVDELYVAPGFRGLGLGRRAVEFLAARCRALDVKALHLEVERDNRRARALYRTSGFVDHARVLMTRFIAPRRDPPRATA